MNLTKLVVRRPVSAIVLIAAVIIFGLMSIVTMPQELTPEMELPMLITVTIYGGAGPEDVDKLVTQEIESSVGSLSGVKSVTSQSSENVSIVMLTYQYGTNMDIAYTDLKERLDQLSNTLPESANSPIVMELDMNAFASMMVSISSDSRDDLLNFTEDDLVPEFEKLASVSDVTVSGGLEDYIKVELIAERMQQHGISMNSVATAVTSADFSMPIGSADFGDQSLAVRAETKYKTLDALRNIPVSTATGDVIRISDVANIYITTRDATSISRYNGQDNIGLSIQKRQSSSAVTMSRQVQQVINQLDEEYADISFHVIYDAGDSITSSVRSVGSTLILGVILSMVVLYVFLGDVKASLIVGSSMPVSLLITFIFMNLMGFSLNVVSLSGMVLGVGMMVDNSIVVIDSCFKHHTKENSFIDSAIEGTQFVMLSILASTITTIVVFLPLALIEGMSGQLFRPLGFTIVFSLLASLVSAITLVPLFFVQFQPREHKNALAARWLKRVEESYGNLLRRLLGKKKTVFGVSLALLAFSLFLGTKLNMELMPSMDEGIVSISVDVRPGLKIEQLDEIMTNLEEMVAQHDDVDRYTLSAGGSGIFSSGDGSLTVYLKDKRKMDTSDVIDQWREETMDILDCDIDISESSSTSMSMGGDSVQIALKGNDLDQLKIASNQVIEVMKQHPDILRTTSTLADTTPQAEIVVDPMKAAAYGLSPALVAQNVYAALNGTETVDVRLDDDRSYTIWVEYPDGRYQNLSDVGGMILMTATGDSVALTEVAAIELADGPQTLVREDSQYYVTVTGTPRSSARFTAAADIEASVQELDLPRNVYIAKNSQQESMDEEFASLGMAILTAVLLVFMVMAIQFESIKHSIMVMTCLPFALIGSFGFLYLFGGTISMVSLLGFLILVGTVVNNGILFVDTANQYRQNMEVKEALVETGRTRLRPILMTTLTTILSMIPLGLGIGSGAEMMQGMGMTVIGGLGASTILTLLLLPTFYLVIDGNQHRKEKRKEKRSERKVRRHAKVESRLSRQEQNALRAQQRKQARKSQKGKLEYRQEDTEDENEDEDELV